MKKTVNSTKKCLRNLAGVIVFAFPAQMVLAAIPKAPQIDSSVTDGDYISILRAYFKSGIGLLTIVFMAVALYLVGSNLLTCYADYNAGKASIGDLLLRVVIAVILLVATIYMVAQATGVFD